jgi:hypothetical protein
MVEKTVPQAVCVCMGRKKPQISPLRFAPVEKLAVASDFGIWQRCQISRLFREDAQGAQVINLSILPR